MRFDWDSKKAEAKLCRAQILTILSAKNGTLRLVTHGSVGYLRFATRTDPEQFESSMRVA